MSSIQFYNVSKSFGENEVIPCFNLDIEESKLTVLLGPSGCGKSTLLRLIAGLELPDSGKIMIDGIDVCNIPPRKRNVAMVFQNYALYPHLTVRENLSFPLKIAKLKKKEITRKVENAAEMLGITSLLDRFPKTLSGGERQRTAVGRAIVRQPQVFLFDEPLSNLDFQLRNQMRTELVALQKQLRKTMIYVTHDQTEGMTMADNLVVMNKGNIMQSNLPQQVYDKPENVFTATFIGSPKMNILKCNIENGELKIGSLATGIKIENLNNGEYLLGVRPDDTKFSNQDRNIKAKIEYQEYQGSASYLYCKIEQEDIIVKADTSLLIENNAIINIELTTEKLHFFDIDSGQRVN